MTIDSSAIIAILLDEPERAEFIHRIVEAQRRLLSSVSLLEAGMVLMHRRGDDAELDLERFVHRLSVEIVSFNAEQSALARLAFRRYGAGRHPAGLNFGDCAAYALAKWSGEPLLYKGTDFRATDVLSAIGPLD
ncbi:MAG: type II toxin-antitoxin system VapC family toxin [Bryobacterales bacterium]|jgi:ribonuclease VapC|nr:type II toxin-antitoxin system VapC family toxin [Bryobacterales bacterium]